MVSDSILAELNRWSRSVEGLDAADDWFAKLPDEARMNALRGVCMMLSQAHPRREDVDGLPALGVGERWTPTVMLRTSVRETNKLMTLPGVDQARAFRALLALFSIADERRRTETCRGACDHWWHAPGIAEGTTLEVAVERVEDYGLYFDTPEGAVLVLIVDVRAEPVRLPETFRPGDPARIRLLRQVEDGLWKATMMGIEQPVRSPIAKR